MRKKAEKNGAVYGLLDRIIEKHTASPKNDPEIINYSLREYKEGGKKHVSKRSK